MICYNDKCNKQFEKGVGIVDEENWYCSEECANTCEYRMMLKSNIEVESNESYEEESEYNEVDEDDYDPMNDF